MSAPAIGGWPRRSRWSTADCAIDFYAGPTEILIVAQKAPAAWVAADLIAQAEHDPDARAVCITTSGRLAEAIAREVALQLPLEGPAAASLWKHGGIIVASSMAEAVDLANQAASEHVVVETDAVAARMVNAGAIFVGPWTAQVAGDYAIGSNHVLPTAGAARFRGGLNAADFVKLLSVQRRLRAWAARVGADHHHAGARRGARGACAVDRRTRREWAGVDLEDSKAPGPQDRVEDSTMTTIQGAPDLGPGLRLHQNENTGGCSPKVVEAVRGFTAERLALYPDFTSAILETAAYLGVDPNRLVLTNGLDEGILLASIACLLPRAPQALVDLGAAPSGAAEILVALPTFEPYLQAARAMGARIVSIPATPDFSFPLDAVLRAVTPNTRIVYVNNPNNPTGQPIPQGAIRRVAREAGHALVFVDEAYHDFMDENFLAEAASYPNVMVGRTFSKAYGLAGMRVGALIASPAVLEPVRQAMPLFNLNVVAVEALRAAIADTTFRPWYLAQAAESKALIYAACEKLGLRYWKSAANFVLVDGGARAKAIVAGLQARGVFVRDRTADPSCPNCFRVTAGVVEHTQAAVDALEAVCAAR